MGEGQGLGCAFKGGAFFSVKKAKLFLNKSAHEQISGLLAFACFRTRARQEQISGLVAFAFAFAFDRIAFALNAEVSCSVGDARVGPPAQLQTVDSCPLAGNIMCCAFKGGAFFSVKKTKLFLNKSAHEPVSGLLAFAHELVSGLLAFA